MLTFFRWWIGITLLLPGLQASAFNDTLSLDGTWELRRADSRKAVPAVVPGTIHEALLSAGKIPHPYLANQEKKVQWIERHDWVYRRAFDWTPGTEREVWLQFDGLDTYAAILLNGDTLFQADNQFRSWHKEVKHLLKAGRNALEVHLTSPLRYHDLTPAQNRYAQTAGNDQAEEKVSVFTRKAPFQFGWDWGPRLVGGGIWKSVRLVRVQHAHFLDVTCFTDSLSADWAQVRLPVELRRFSADTLQLQLRAQSGALLVDTLVTSARALLRLDIPDPQRWWVQPLGKPHLYDWTLELRRKGQLLDVHRIQYGLRTIKLVQSPDSIGTSYYFRLNGIPLFAKGANMIPLDAIDPAGSEQEYRDLLQDAHSVGMNMVRVWGGGVYPPDSFYELCDSLGILVWQDLMFACSMYPADSLFRENVRQEVEEQKRRIQHHPCLALWCGNNEVGVAWENWGWQQSLGIGPTDSLHMIQGYQSLFDTLFPTLLQSENDIPYVPTSPLSNWGTPENFNHGSMHYWGVWHGGDLLSDYENRVGRFMSEYGFQSFPAPSTIRRYAPLRRQQRLQSPVQLAHQKSYVGNREIEKQMEAYYRPPRDFWDFVYKSQLTQRMGMQIAIRAHRGSAGHCMGSLYWQLNDCWPGPSWSSIDYYGRWKAFHYELRQLFHPILIIPAETEEDLHLRIVNDYPDTLQGELRLRLFHLDGTLLAEFESEAELPPLGYSDHLSWKQLLRELDGRPLPPPSQRCLRIRWKSKDTTLQARTTHYWVPPKELALPEAAFHLRLHPDRSVLTVQAKSFIKDLFLEAGANVHFQQNFLDLLPGEEVEIPYEGQLPALSAIRHHSLH